MQTRSVGGIALGDGPVRPIISNSAKDALRGTADLVTKTEFPPWLAFKTLWYSDPTYRGPFTIRARKLGSPGPIGIGGSPTETKIVGPTIRSADGNQAPSGTWVMAPGCYAWQVDGLTFSELIVVHAILP